MSAAVRGAGDTRHELTVQPGGLLPGSSGGAVTDLVVEHALTEQDFLADRRRRDSDEVDLGATWRAAGSTDTWRLAWLRATGELYACRTDGLDGSGSSVRVLAVLEDERTVDETLDGWRDARDGEDGLGWAQSRLAPAA